MSSDAAATACSVRVEGRVQGVFFRDSCRQEAERLDVRGWVCNEPDGSVAAYFEGTEAAVAAMVAWCREGPPAARVERVDVDAVSPQGLRGFAVR